MNTNTPPQAIVFTDLDGTLLDHETYDYSPALPVIRELQALEIPVIITTSKTWAEARRLKEEIGLRGPCITENGGVITMPDGDQVFLGTHYDEILNIINDLPKELRAHIKGFSDLGLEGVIEATGLPKEVARLSIQRQVSEPFLFDGSEEELEAIREAFKKYTLRIVQGGRFYHAIGVHDKTDAMYRLYAHYRHIDGDPISIALGDGPNDAAMIGAAHYGIIIPNSKGVPVEVENPAGEVRRAKVTGPEGWASSMRDLLSELSIG